MKNYLEEFKKMAEEIQNDERFEVTEFQINPGATEENFKNAKAKGVTNEDIFSFFREANGVTFRWKLKEDSDQCGTINILPIEVIFEDDDFKLDGFEMLQILDFFIDEACAAFYIDGKGNPEVYYYYLGEEMASMRMDFNDYMDALLKSRGYWYWQTSIAEPEWFNIGSPRRSEEVYFRKNMPNLFSDFNNDDFVRIDQETNNLAVHDKNETWLETLEMHYGIPREKSKEEIRKEREAEIREKIFDKKPKVETNLPLWKKILSFLLDLTKK